MSRSLKPRSPSAVLGAVVAPAGALLLGSLLLGASCNDITQFVQARDGALLASDVYDLPDPAPTVVIRTPYGKEGVASTGTALNSLGFSAVIQDLRGTGESDGTFMLFYDDGWGANQDGYDTVQWAASSSWSNGDVCFYGGSALAMASLYGAGAAPPNLRCVFALVGTADPFHHAAYQGGALRESMLVGWLTGLGHTEALEAALSSPLETDELWQNTTVPNRYGAVTVPIYHMGGWYDIFTQGTVDGFVGLQEGGGMGARGHQKLLVGPWTHGGTSGELTYPGGEFIGGEEVRWLQHYLQGADNGVDTEPPVTYYLMGDPDRGVGEGNRWIDADAWPPPSTATSWYLRDGGVLSPQAPGAGEPAEGFTYDPTDPVPTVGGNNLILPAGPFDQRGVLGRPDVLLWQTAALDAPVTVAGRIRARLFVSSSAVDTDFTVKLMDIYPDGRAMLVLDGIQRMRFREGQDHEVLMTPGQIYQADVDLWSTALVFEEGHRIAVAVSSSNATRFDVNPNTGAWSHDGGPTEIAQQTLYQDPGHPSRLVLPVIPGGL